MSWVRCKFIGVFTVTVYCTGVLRGLTVPSPSRNALSKHADGMGRVENGPYTGGKGGTGDTDYGKFQNDMYEMHTI